MERIKRHAKRLLDNSEKHGYFYDLSPERQTMLSNCITRLKNESIPTENWILFEIPYWDSFKTVLCFSNPQRTEYQRTEYVAFDCFHDKAIPFWVDQQCIPHHSNSILHAILMEKQQGKGG
ncbi:hypothetical protein V6615_16390 (plasmid) [Oscillospiraceae bacterium PP1C4]